MFDTQRVEIEWGGRKLSLETGRVARQAGAAVVADSLKIDLSKLFGAPDTGESAEAIAIRERDEQLMLSGRSAVGATVGLPKRQTDKADAPKDDLDSLLDALDDADL